MIPDDKNLVDDVITCPHTRGDDPQPLLADVLR